MIKPSVQLITPVMIILLHLSGAAQYISGFGRALEGETIKYESQQPDANESLLVRSMEQRKFIEWETDTIPVSFDSEYAEFIMIAGIDVNPGDNHAFNMYINEELQFTFRNPLDTLPMDWNLQGRDGVSLRLKGMMIDKYGDLFGYLFLSVPRHLCTPGKPIRIRVEGETANSRSWFMVFKYSAVQQVKFIQEKALERNNGSENQLVRVDILHFDQPAMAAIQIGKAKHQIPIDLGFNMIRVPIARVHEPTAVKASVRLNDREIANTELVIQPVEKKTIYLLPHSHVDIGYTHVQEEVESIQWQNIRDAVSFSVKTKDYPEGSRFKWNAEVMWAVDSYLKHCTVEEKAALKEAVQNGSFELDGIYANILTGLCRPEELFRMMKSAVKTAESLGVELQSAMITDIPGYSWGIVPVMAQSGIKYFSIGTNTFHRIGDIIETWGDKPFYWVSPSGNEKILCWIHGKGYSEFHTGLAYTQLRNKLKEQLIFDYVNELADKGYPYDIVTMRYNIGSDNGPPDPYLADIVKNWNEKYSSPKLIISTVGEAFGLFEEKYGNTLPSYSGDLTGYWEDGAASSARETAMNRASAERLTQASILYSLVQPDNYNDQLFDQAWQNILLYSEHTWGSWNSISEPHNPFTLQQWDTKKSFAETAHEQSVLLLNQALPSSMSETATMVDVYNSSSWERTDLVTIPANVNTRGDVVKDKEGSIIPSQRLSTGELVFVADQVAPHSASSFFFEQKPEKRKKGDETDEMFYPYSHIDLKLDEATGSITSLIFNKLHHELVSSDGKGLNEFLYVEGRNPETAKGVDQVKISLLEDGPVLKTIRIESLAPGCESLTREIRLYKKLDRIDIMNIVDKKEILEPEGVHFAFPFNVPGGKVRISNAWSHYQAESGQMPGSNKNFFSVNRWADVSNDTCGVTFVTLDAPLLEIGDITCDPIEVGYIDTLEQSQTLLSYPMNNYWETNYKAGQAGKTSFRYALYPHHGFDPLMAEKRGIEQHQPLISVVTDMFMSIGKPYFKTIVSEEVIIESMIPLKGKGIVVRLYNPAEKAVVMQIDNEDGRRNVYLCDPYGGDLKPLDDELVIDSGEVLHLLREDR